MDLHLAAALLSGIGLLALLARHLAQRSDDHDLAPAPVPVRVDDRPRQ